ncbi:MAG TPA: DUF4105 domain-containing protein [Bacteroidales bacterium]|nr:DUF4105 domain-containing protein [Bacteroidales bacterium]HRT90016.1 DUF4105 domain-containing protein [Bacteroidales bacterium]
MNRLTIAIVLFCISGLALTGQSASSDTSVYLITCAPGNEIYSIYGHSALRVVIPSSGTDLVYNWGVFDFRTKNFAWKFARGRLNYMLGVYPYDMFLRDYMLERRSVISQRVNIEKEDLDMLMALLNNNLRPENIFYRYDFLYDNCATRIRDLFEKVYSSRLIYPPDERKDIPTFREKIAEYQRYYPWLNAGIDFLLGTPVDKKAFFRDRMFLPEDLQKNLSKAVVSRNRLMIPLLGAPEVILEFDSHQVMPSALTSPFLLLSLLFVVILVLSAKLNRTLLNYADILIFSVFSILSLLMIFFSFFTDHEQTKWNLNLIWSNPIVPFCLASLVLNKNWSYLFRMVSWLSVIFITVALILPGRINMALIPVVMIMALRSAARAGMLPGIFSIDENGRV